MNQTSPSVLAKAEAYIAQKVQQNAVEDAAGRQALATPLAGSAADAFKPQPEIPIGDYKVRPFYDVDFEFLQWLDHPLHKMMTAGLKGEEATTCGCLPRGPQAWQLAYILTRPARETAALFRSGGATAVKDAAQDTMGELTIGPLSQLNEAALTQMEGYWSTVVQHGPAEEAKGSANPT